MTGYEVQQRSVCPSCSSPGPQMPPNAKELSYTNSLKNDGRWKAISHSDHANLYDSSKAYSLACTCVIEHHEKSKPDHSGVFTVTEEKQMWSLNICQVSRHYVGSLNTTCQECSRALTSPGLISNPSGLKKSFVAYAVGCGHTVGLSENNILFSFLDAIIIHSESEFLSNISVPAAFTVSTSLSEILTFWCWILGCLRRMVSYGWVLTGWCWKAGSPCTVAWDAESHMHQEHSLLSWS